MKTLLDHNRDAVIKKEIGLQAGVLCDKCGNEMKIVSVTATLFGKRVVCPTCGTRGVKL